MGIRDWGLGIGDWGLGIGRGFLYAEGAEITQRTLRGNCGRGRSVPGDVGLFGRSLGGGAEVAIVNVV
jgi:hypothetical protein